MTCTIKCLICNQEFTVKGQDNGPNSFSVHENADLSGCCEHIQKDESLENIDFIGYDDE